MTEDDPIKHVLLKDYYDAHLTSTKAKNTIGYGIITKVHKSENIQEIIIDIDKLIQELQAYQNVSDVKHVCISITSRHEPLILSDEGIVENQKMIFIAPRVKVDDLSDE